VHPSAASAATVVLLIVAAAFVVATGPPQPQTRLDFGMDAGPGKDAGQGPRAERAVARRRAQRPPPSRLSPRATITRYYLDLDRRRFADAWRVLSPAVRDAAAQLHRALGAEPRRARLARLAPDRLRAPRRGSGGLRAPS